MVNLDLDQVIKNYVKNPDFDPNFWTSKEARGISKSRLGLLDEWFSDTEKKVRGKSFESVFIDEISDDPHLSAKRKAKLKPKLEVSTQNPETGSW